MSVVVVTGSPGGTGRRGGGVGRAAGGQAQGRRRRRQGRDGRTQRASRARCASRMSSCWRERITYSWAMVTADSLAGGGWRVGGGRAAAGASGWGRRPQRRQEG